MQVLVAGVVVRLEASSPPGLLDLRAALGAAPCATDRTPGDAPAFVLRSASGTLRQPDRRPDRVVQHVRYWDDGADVVLASGPGLTARVSPGCAVVDPGEGGVSAVHCLLLPVLTLLVRQQGWCLVHGGAFLLGEPREAVLLLGGSGRGKSTLVTAALCGGLPVLTDDLVVLSLRDGELRISGIPQPLALPADQAHLGIAGRSIAGDARGRWTADVPLETGTHAAAAVLLVEHSDRPEGHLRPADGRDVLRGLLASSLDGLDPGQARTVFPYGAAAARLPAWQLGHAVDPAERIPAALRRLDEIAQAGAVAAT